MEADEPGDPGDQRAHVLSPLPRSRDDKPRQQFEARLLRRAARIGHSGSGPRPRFLSPLPGPLDILICNDAAASSRAVPMDEEAVLAEDPGPLRAGREGARLASGSFAQDLMSRVRTQLAALRGQVSRLNVALTSSEQAKLAVDRRTIGAGRAPLPLAQPLRGGVLPVEKAEQLVSVWLNDDHLHALVEARLLDPREVGDRVKVAAALRKAMDRWSQRISNSQQGPVDAQARGRRQGLSLPARIGDGDDRIIRLEAARAARTAARLTTAAGATAGERPHAGPLCGIAPAPPAGRSAAAPLRRAAPVQDAQRVDRQRQPDERERGQVNGRERLAVDEHRQQEVSGRARCIAAARPWSAGSSGRRRRTAAGVAPLSARRAAGARQSARPWVRKAPSPCAASTARKISAAGESSNVSMNNPETGSTGAVLRISP